MRVFLDTNVLVSAVATRGLCADVMQACLAEHQLVLGGTVLSELRHVLERKLQLPPETVGELDSFLRRHAVVIKAAPPLSIDLRNPSDIPVLAEASAGEADVLVTGDRDLLDAATEAPLPILSPRAFWEQLRSNPRAIPNRGSG